MAADSIAVHNGTANPNACVASELYHELERVRRALIGRIDAAAERAKWGRNAESEGMPYRLFAAGCFLASHNFEDKPCEGERWFNCNFIAYRALASAESVEDGRRAIYEGGRRAIAPVQTLQVAA